MRRPGRTELKDKGRLFCNSQGSPRRQRSTFRLWVTLELPKAEQAIDDWSPYQKVGICRKRGTILIPSPWSNFCKPNCLANSLNRQKTHMSARAKTALFILRMITNLMKAPATMTAMILFKNQASLSLGAKKSSPMTVTESTKPSTKATRFLWMQSMSRSCEYMTRQTSSSMPTKQRWKSYTMLLGLPKIICRYRAIIRIKMYTKQLRMLKVRGRNFRYWMFHGRIRMKASPIACVIAIVTLGSFTIQDVQPCSQNSMQAFLCSSTRVTSSPFTTVQLTLKSIMVSQLSSSFLIQSRKTAVPLVTLATPPQIFSSLMATSSTISLTPPGTSVILT